MLKRILTAVSCLFVAVMTSSATVTVQGWWHYGEVADLYGDSSGNGRRFGSAFSRVGSGNAGVGIEPFGAGGPLGTSGYTSTSCLYWTPTHVDAAGMWNIGYNPPATNYVIECWCLPEYPGTKPGNRSWLFCSGSSGGVKFQLTNDSEGIMAISAVIIGSEITIGDPWVVDTNHWTHLAIVNDGGTCTYYVNGVPNGAPDVGHALASVPAGDVFAGSAPGTQPTYTGYLDELRMSTFASGQFSTNDLLTRSLAPNILVQPQTTTVWSGGAAPFSVGVAFDNSTTYQWYRGNVAIPGANSSGYTLNVVGAGDNGAQFYCVLNNFTGIAKTTSVATLTVLATNPSNIAAYQSAVTAESSLVAYYPVDGNTGGTLTDVKGGHNGTLEGTAEYDGRTNHAFGVRSLRLKNTADGDVSIPNNPAFEFASGNGTIEAIVALEPAISTAAETIFAEASDGGDPVYYAILTSPDGGSLIYTNDSLTQPITWALPVSLLGRQAHVAVVFNNGDVTAYVDGLSLGTKVNPSFGIYTGENLWIGSMGLSGRGEFTGSLDEVAVYGSALSANTIAIHNSKFLFGTNTAAPSITALPATGTKTLLAGGLASFSVKASGTAPLSYSWTRNGTPIPGANAATLTLSPTAVAQSGTYGVTVSNPYGFTNSPTFVLNFTTPGDRYSSLVMADNPMAYWRLDETNGTTAFDAAGGHDGAYSGAVTLGAGGVLPGIADSGAHFSGGNAQVPFSATLNPSGPFSVELWVKPDDINIYVPICSQFRNGNARDGWCFYMENDADSFETHLGNNSGVSHYAYGQGGPLKPNYWYHLVEVWDGVNTSTLYSENQIVGQNTQVALGGTYVPNPSAPLLIGVRNGGSFPIHGVLDEVALYNYALTTDQISNHWSIKFQAPNVTTAPLGVTNVEGSTITLSVVAAGFPNTYQWLANNNPLSGTSNPDTTLHYPQDVTNATLVIAEATPADSGLYQVTVANPLGTVTTVAVKVLIVPDTNKPVVVSATALGTPNVNGGTSPYLVKVLYNKRMDVNTASDITKYSFNPAVGISSVTMSTDYRASVLGGDWKEVLIATTGLTPGQKYGLTVSGVNDQAVTPNTIAPSTTYFRAPLLTSGSAELDYYYLGSGSGVANLIGNALFPNTPQTNAYLTAFDSSLFTGGDLNNVGAFGALGDNYGVSVSGWIKPTVSGDYTFFLWSDDASQLDLSTDASPLNLSTIAYEPNCCHSFTEPGSVTYTSDPQTLVAGQSYFIRALQVEGGGGDYVKVAWRISTDATPAANLTPIPGLYLSSYSPVALPVFGVPTITGGSFSLGWVGYQAVLQQSTDLKTWSNVPGNPNPLVVPVGASQQKFYRLVQ